MMNQKIKVERKIQFWTYWLLIQAYSDVNFILNYNFLVMKTGYFIVEVKYIHL